jgi:IS30 family transposase
MYYQHLTTFERGRIEALHNSGYTVREIGQQMNRHHSTIARELSRNKIINSVVFTRTVALDLTNRLINKLIQ